MRPEIREQRARDKATAEAAEVAKLQQEMEGAAARLAPRVIGARIAGESFERLERASRQLDVGVPTLIRAALSAYLGEPITAPRISTGEGWD